MAFLCTSLTEVALLAEGVDRNYHLPPVVRMGQGVALLAEGVDRNILDLDTKLGGLESPSSRRAWIEIFISWIFTSILSSPSSRRAWIEISSAYYV